MSRVNGYANGYVALGFYRVEWRDGSWSFRLSCGRLTDRPESDQSPSVLEESFSRQTEPMVAGVISRFDLTERGGKIRRRLGGCA